MGRFARHIGAVLCAGLISCLLVGCSLAPSPNQNTAPKKKVTVTTSFLADMVRTIAGDTVEISMIIPAGEDPHLYEAKPEDHTKIAEADLVLYHGLHFEGKMVEILEVKGRAVSENFPSNKIYSMEEDGHKIPDPHFWFDISLYKLAVQEATDQLCELVPEQAEFYRANCNKYLQELDKLDAENKQALQSIPEGQRYLITPHDAFNYFSHAYNIEVRAPQGVSTDSEVAIDDIKQTVDFIVEHRIKAIFAESTTDPARMQRIQEACKAQGWEVKVVSGEGQELFSDSLAPQGEEGDNYLSMYRHNIALIVNNLK